MPPPPSPDPTPGAAIVRQLRRKGIRDPRVLDAFDRVPRPRFVPPEARDQALADRAVMIGCDQTISQPFMVAVMTVELALTGVERVLEVGTGSGYQTAILARLAREVFTVERHATLSLRARGILDGLGFENVHYRIGDGTLGWPEVAPFDRALITAAAPRVPGPIFAQLAEGGLLVLPLGDEESQRLTVVRKVKGRPVVREGLVCRFVPLIGREGWGEPAG
jgi:protein-L-isoaspartate(D-aspartate) O-methyltransferase